MSTEFNHSFAHVHAYAAGEVASGEFRGAFPLVVAHLAHRPAFAFPDESQHLAKYERRDGFKFATVEDDRVASTGLLGALQQFVCVLLDERMGAPTAKFGDSTGVLII